MLLSAAGELVQAGARLLFFGGALFLLSWKLALASLVVVPLFYFTARRFAGLARRAARERRRRSGSLTAVAEEALGNAALVQTAGTQDRELARFRRENEGAIAAELAGTRISGLFAPIIDLIELAGVILIIVLGTWALSAGDLTLGGLLAFLAYLAQLYRPIRDVSRLGQTLFEAAAGAERVIELLDTPPAITERPGAVALDKRPRPARARPRHLHLSRVAAPRARAREPARPARPLRRARRRERRRQVDGGQARAALRRSRRRRRAARRPRRPRPHAALAARQRGAAAAGRAAVRRHGARQRGLRSRGVHRRRRARGARGGRRRRARGRAPGRPGHARRPARPCAVRRPAAARGDGTCAPPGRARARPRRAVRRARRRRHARAARAAPPR